MGRIILFFTRLRKSRSSILNGTQRITIGRVASAKTFETEYEHSQISRYGTVKHRSFRIRTENREYIGCRTTGYQLRLLLYRIVWQLFG